MFDVLYIIVIAKATSRLQGIGVEVLKAQLGAMITIMMEYRHLFQPMTIHKEMEMNMILRWITLLDFCHQLQFNTLICLDMFDIWYFDAVT